MPSKNPNSRNASAKRRPTLADVAADAGVSRATASLVFRGSPLISEGTTEKVLASMERLGYVYNRAAASLRARKSHTIGLAVTDITNPFFSELAVAIEQQLGEAQYTLLLTNSGEAKDRQTELLTMMHGYQIDGLLLCPALGTTEQDLKPLHRWGLPTVLIARDVPASRLPYVGPDNVLGARLAVEHLLSRGHKRIAFVGGPTDSPARVDRITGYIAALDAGGVSMDPRLCPPSPVTRKGGFEAIQTVLHREDRPTAALCYNDVVAFGAMLGLETAGLRPGADFAIVGFDNIADSALWHPSLSTVSITPAQIADKAALQLLLCIAKPAVEPYKTVIPPELMVRDSS